MKAEQKQKLLDAAADRLKMANHYAESFRKQPHDMGRASTLRKVTEEAMQAVTEYHKAVLTDEQIKQN